MTVVGKNIAQRRKALGMTQEELATKMGYKSKSTINKIELGINDIVQSKVVKFAEVLQTTPATLMGWEETQKKADSISEAVLKMKTDAEFLSMVDGLRSLDAEQRAVVKHLISTFLK